MHSEFLFLGQESDSILALNPDIELDIWVGPLPNDSYMS